MDLAVLSARVELGVAVGLDGHQLQVEVVVLGSDQDGDGARVVLEERVRRKKTSYEDIAAHTGRP